MTQVIKTTEKTLNKTIKRQLLALMPTAKKLIKRHVAGVGYVFFVKDANGGILGKTFKEVGSGMTIYVN